MAGAIRVLVVDDSASVRRRVQELLSGDPGIEIVGTAADGVEALEMIRSLRPDVVTLDVVMPRLDGLKVLATLMRERPTRVLMLSSHTHEGAEVTLQALDLGAIDFIDKTELKGEAARNLPERIRAVAGVESGRLLPGGPPPPKTTGRAPGAGGGIEVVVIGASTGGPPALQRVIPALPGDLPAAVVVVQHMPAGFTRPFAGRLDAASALSVREAVQGEAVMPGSVLVAPGGLHLTIRRHPSGLAVALGVEPAGSIHRPSVDLAMESAATTCGARASGVLLTGMGTDGARGMVAIHRAGGHTIAESDETSVVPGMPRAAVELGGASEVVRLEAVAARVAAAVAASRAGRD